MKKIYLIAIIMLSLMFVACSSVESTDLNNIKIDSISLGQSIDTIDLSKYELKDEYDDYDYNFEEVRIRIDDSNNIDKIWLNILENDLLSIDKENSFKNIEQITATLGSNYKEYWYDKGQRLKAHEYIDNETKTKMNFVYVDLNNQEKKLVWVILENL